MRHQTYSEARAKLPADAKISCTFGYQGLGGYAEFYRTPDHRRFTIQNGPHDAVAPFDWTISEVE